MTVNVHDKPNHLEFTQGAAHVHVWFANPRGCVTGPCGDTNRLLFEEMHWDITDQTSMLIVKMLLHRMTNRHTQYTNCSGALALLEES